VALRAEFDPANRILLLQFEGQLTDEAISEFYVAIRKHWTAADASMGIVYHSTLHWYSNQRACVSVR